jgi:2-iminobutanoate/2-iminopropanoate deaminase
MNIYIRQLKDKNPTVVNSIQTQSAPKPVGPYSQAITANGFIFCSGQIALSPRTNLLVGKTVLSQTNQAFKNIKAILNKAGVTMNQVVQVRVFLTDLYYIPDVNKVFLKYFSNRLPARTMVGVSHLPLGACIELEAIATLSVK